MSVYVYVDMCMHVYGHMYICIYLCMYMYMYKYIYMCMYTDTHICKDKYQHVVRTHAVSRNAGLRLVVKGAHQTVINPVSPKHNQSFDG